MVIRVFQKFLGLKSTKAPFLLMTLKQYALTELNKFHKLNKFNKCDFKKRWGK